MMIILALIIGGFYGYVSSKGQFCMNSGFSNVFRKKDTTKLKSYITAILLQMMILPLLFTTLYLSEPSHHFINNIGLPPLYLMGSAVGGFFFGIFMYYSAGCGAGIFYKIGEKSTGAVIATVGFIIGVFIATEGFLKFITNASHSIGHIEQPVLWKSESPILMALIIAGVAAVLLYLVLKNGDMKPGNADWGWKKTGMAIGIIGTAGWIAAILVSNPFGMSIIPGALDLVEFKYSWALLFLLGIPIGAFLNTRSNTTKRFAMPTANIAARRLFGGLGLGISGSIAAGCTVGHGLTFAPLLGIGSLVATLFIFLGSGLMGYLTR